MYDYLYTFVNVSLSVTFLLLLLFLSIDEVFFLKREKHFRNRESDLSIPHAQNPF